MTEKEFALAIQRALVERGFDPGPEDGIGGKRTLDALMLALGPISEQHEAGAWDARSMKNLEGVHADLRRVLSRAREDSPIPFVVIEGMRTVARQKELVRSGASQTMRSRHLTGHAADVAPLDRNGKIVWDWPLYHRLAVTIKQAAASLGVPVEWGGDWKTFKDGPHWQLPWDKYPG